MRVSVSSCGETQKTRYGRPRGSDSVQAAGKVGSRGTSSTKGEEDAGPWGENHSPLHFQGRALLRSASLSTVLLQVKGTTHEHQGSKCDKPPGFVLERNGKQGSRCHADHSGNAVVYHLKA
jgi:hypothetical protein